MLISHTEEPHVHLPKDNPVRRGWQALTDALPSHMLPLKSIRIISGTFRTLIHLIALATSGSSHQVQDTDACIQTTTGSAPSYFHSLLRIYIPSRSLRSASERRLVVPSQRGSKSLSRTFSFTIPGWWNNLPTPIRNAGSLSIFKQQLKTHLFRHYLTSS